METQVSAFGGGGIGRFGRLGMPDGSGYEGVVSERSGRSGDRPGSDRGFRSPTSRKGSAVFETFVAGHEGRIVDFFKDSNGIPSARYGGAPGGVDGIRRVDPSLAGILEFRAARKEIGVRRVGDLPGVRETDSVNAVKKSVVFSFSAFGEEIVEKILHAAVLVDSAEIEIAGIPIGPLISGGLFAAGSDRRFICRISHVTDGFGGDAGQAEHVFAYEPVSFSWSGVRIGCAVIRLDGEFHGRPDDVGKRFVERARFVRVSEIRRVFGPSMAEFVCDDVDGGELADARSVAVAEEEPVSGIPEGVGVIGSVVHNEMGHRLRRVGKVDIADSESERLEKVERFLEVVACGNFYGVAISPVARRTVRDVVGIHVGTAVCGDVVYEGQAVYAVEYEVASVIAAVRSR